MALVAFSTFEATNRPECTDRNGQTGATMTITAAKVFIFSPGKALKDAVNV